ncbi:phage protein [Streptococcus pneumoniae]|nr:phage protein [Streptococcus pneumoniae]VIX26849.1 phage protein [Streptococcus pneumoniae]VPC39448.1 phage protein [Streptococcus pneumoniae]
MLELYFVYNGHCKFYLGTFDNVDDLIEHRKFISLLNF